MPAGRGVAGWTKIACDCGHGLASRFIRPNGANGGNLSSYPPFSAVWAEIKEVFFMTKRIISVLLCVLTVLSVFVIVPVTSASAASHKDSI